MLLCTGGSSGWDDAPRWKKDEFGDWDPDKGGGISRGSGKHGNRSCDDIGNNRQIILFLWKVIYEFILMREMWGKRIARIQALHFAQTSHIIGFKVYSYIK
jgi:hypothetical protein